MQAIYPRRPPICSVTLNLHFASLNILNLQPMGWSQGDKASALCDVCMPGSHQPSERRSTCIDCEVGRYADSSGLTECSECPPGKAQGEKGRASCLPCIPGRTSGVKGLFKCTTCSPGMFTAGMQDTKGCLSCVSRMMCLQCLLDFFMYRNLPLSN